ncbi:MAG: hypothetical protein ACJAS4_002844 [Bacteriovoracaceae bacterium]|jgi:hypothetical protein
MKAAIETFRKDKNIDFLKQSIFHELKEKGFVHPDAPCSRVLYAEIGKRLGNVIMENDIEIKPNGSFAAFRPQKVIPHTDSADAHIIGWHCIEQDSMSGASKVTDIGILNDYFNKEELAFLKKYKAPLQDKKDRTSKNIQGLSDSPLVIERWGTLKVNYAPWLSFGHTDPSKHEVLKKFQYYIKNRIKYNTTSILLKKGEVMFIDNGQVLHSRDAIHTNSKRCLRRLWIKTCN